MRQACCFVVAAVLVAACAKPDDGPAAVKPGVASPATKAAASDGDDLAKPNPTPASMKEIVAAIDLRMFPVMDGAIYVQKSPAGVHFSVPKGDFKQAVEFFRVKLAEQGWKPSADPKMWGLYESGAQLIFVKNSFKLFASIGVSPGDGNMNAGLFNIGNIDARKFPMMPGAEVVDSMPSRVIIKTDAKPDKVREFAREEMKKLGWHEYRRPPMKGMPAGADPELKFLNQAMALDGYIAEQDGKTQAYFTVRVLKEQLPVMPDAGRLEFSDEQPLSLFYHSPSKMDKILDYYRKELADLGWKQRDGIGSVDNENGKAKLVFDAPDKEPIRLETLQDVKVCFVQILKWTKDDDKKK